MPESKDNSRKRPLRVACIGCGTIAQGYGPEQGGHIRSVLDYDPEIELVLVDKKHEVAEAAAKKFGIARYTNNVDEVLADHDVDCVLILTYNSTHVDLIVRAIEEGKHIFVEKPLAMNGEECKRIVAAQRKNNHRKKIMVGHRFRFADGIRAAKEQFGRPDVIFGQLMDDRWAREFWANDPVLGGGSILSQGVHIIDAMHMMMGETPEKVFATGGNYTQLGVHPFDSVAVNVSFRSGSIGTLLLGDCGQNAISSKFFLEVFKSGEQSCVVNNRLKDAFFYRESKLINEVRGRENFNSIMRSFFDAILRDQDVGVSIADGIASIAVVEAIKESAAARREIAVPPLLDDILSA